MVTGAYDRSKEGKYICDRGWIAKFLEVVVQADDFGHIVDPFVKNFINKSSAIVVVSRYGGTPTITPL